MNTIVRPALVLFVALTLICCVVYPYVITGIGQLVFPHRANGSMVISHGQVVGSRLIGQAFTSPKYFWGRPSATSPQPNDASSSTGSNLGPTNPAQINAVKSRVAALHSVDPNNTLPIPIDLVTASGSGVDPELSLASAYYQAERVARERKLLIGQVYSLIKQHSHARHFGFWGEPRVNVLELNLALDDLSH